MEHRFPAGSLAVTDEVGARRVVAALGRSVEVELEGGSWISNSNWDGSVRWFTNYLRGPDSLPNLKSGPRLMTGLC